MAMAFCLRANHLGSSGTSLASRRIYMGLLRSWVEDFASIVNREACISSKFCAFSV